MEKDPLQLDPTHLIEAEGDEKEVDSPHWSSAAGAGSTGSLDANYLLLQYGKAMATIGQLENRISALREQLESVKALEKSALEQGSGSVEQLREQLSLKDGVINLLNSRNDTLSKGLEQLKARLAEGGGRRPTRQRHRTPKKWWQFWSNHHRG